jgi:CHRD domain
MKKVCAALLLVVTLAVLVLGFTDGFKNIKELLTGSEEVPYISTTSNGEFTARINEAETEITYTLNYSALEGDVQQSHIHLGQAGVNGGITVFLCTNLGNGPAGTQPCPPAPATITGVITAADVSPNIPATLPARNQGLNTGEFAELLTAIRSGNTYVNVHSSKFPGGEVRSQIHHEHGNSDDK